MKMENQYKTEEVLFILVNLLKRDGNYSKGSLFFYLLPIDWDNKDVIHQLLMLSKELGLRFKNFYFDGSFFEVAFPKANERIRKLVHDKPQTEYSKLQKRILENKFSLADIEKEHWESIDPLFYGHSVSPDSLLEAVVFDVEFPGNSRAKLKKYLKDYIQHFIDDSLTSSKRNIYTFQRHKEILLVILKKLQVNYGNEFVIKSSEFDNDAFLFIHSLLAFEKLNHINLKSIKICEEHWTKNKKGYYEAQISLQPVILEELNRVEVTPSPKIQTDKKKPTTIALYLNIVGDLWKEPKNKYCYQMGEKSDRHKIVRYLASNNGYQPTATISSALEGKSEQSIRTEIGKIRNNIRRLLKIPGNKVIEGRKESGYRINPAYKIFIKNHVSL